MGKGKTNKKRHSEHLVGLSGEIKKGDVMLFAEGWMRVIHKPDVPLWGGPVLQFATVISL